MSDRPKASAPKAPTAKSGAAATSWLAGFITRAAAGIVYAVVFILCLVLGIVPTAIFVSVMSGLCCFEYFRMTKLDGKVANERLGIAAAVLFPLSALGDSLLLNALLFALMLAVGIWYVCSSRTRISDVAVTLMVPSTPVLCCRPSCCCAMPCPVLPRPAFGGCLRVSLGLRFVCLHRGQPYRQAQDGPQDLSQKELGGLCRRHLGLGSYLAYFVGDAFL